MSEVKEPRRTGWIGIVIFLLALISTALAWTGLSLNQLWQALHF